MRIAILGAGFAGLAAAYEVQRQGHNAVIIDKEAYIGGLGAGFREQVDDYPPNWDWDLERYYHHWFTNDSEIFRLAKELHVTDKILIKRPVTASLINGARYQLDSPMALLTFSPLPLWDRIRTGLVLGFLKLFPFGQLLERWTVHDLLPTLVGRRSYQLLWEPLMKGKFDDRYRDINLAWFWARIYKRTTKLAYFVGGFQAFANELATHIKKQGGSLLLGADIEKITQAESQWEITIKGHTPIIADRVIVTTPFPVFAKLFPQLPPDYVQTYSQLKGIGAQALIVVLNKPFFDDHTYWLNIHDTAWPFLVMAEHTNFADPSHYGGDTILYIGNYLAADHPLMQLSKDTLIENILPYLKRIKPDFDTTTIKHAWLWRAPYAQPIVEVNHSQRIPPITTPLQHVYLANMSQVYPWDRGTNYAVELGRHAARLATKT